MSDDKKKLEKHLEGIRESAIKQEEYGKKMVDKILQQDKRNNMDPEYVKSLLFRAHVYVKGLFIYKSGMFGHIYMDKECLADLGGSEMEYLLKGVAEKAFLDEEMSFSENTKIVTVIGPSYGASGYPISVCAYLENAFREWKIIFRPGKTQLVKNDATGKDRHYFPDKLIERYADSDAFMITEDIINSGTTVREVGALVREIFGRSIKHVFCIGNRGGQTAQSIGTERLYALVDEKINQYDPRTSEGLEILNNSGEINTKLGKGKLWVDLFGQPPYPAGTDFSAFGFEKLVGA